jgi:hypothetical protein
MTDKQLRGTKNGHKNTQEHHVQVIVEHGGVDSFLSEQIFEAEKLVDGGVVNKTYFGGCGVRFSFETPNGTV